MMECPYCRSERSRLLNDEDGRNLYRCLECGEVYDDDDGDDLAAEARLELESEFDAEAYGNKDISDDLGYDDDGDDDDDDEYYDYEDYNDIWDDEDQSSCSVCLCYPCMC